MIRLPKTISFNFPSATYVDWTITSSTTCVTLDKTSGRSNVGVFNITVDAQFTDSACVSSTVLTARGVDNNGCIQSTAITFTNPCTSLSATLAAGGEYQAVVTITGGVAPYTVDWLFDSSKFTASTNASSIKLTPIDAGNLNVTTTPVYVQITDSNMCTDTASFNIAIPQVSFPNRFSSVATCFENVITWTIYLENQDAFDKTYLNVLNEDITAVWESNGFLKFSIPDVDYDFQHDLQLKTTGGVLTQVAKVDVAVNLCSELVIPPLRVEQKIGGSSIGVIKAYALSDDGNIDYSTFEFVPSSGQSVAGGVLTTAFGVAELLPSKEIEYTVGTVGFDRVRFKADDVNGNPTEHIDLYIDPYNYPTPTASNFSLNGSVGSLTEDDLSARFSDSIRSFEVVTAPTKGSLSFDGTTLRYLATSSGTDTLVFKGIGLNDISSANVTVTFNNVSSGTAIAGTVCTNGNIDLTSLLVDYDTGGTWTQTSGTTVSLVDPTIVPFSGKPSGFYTFNYTVGSSSTDVTVEHRVYTSDVPSAVFLLPSGNDPNTMRFTVTGCSADITLANLEIKIFRAVSPASPTDPSDYYETITFDSLVSGTATKDYSTTCTVYSYLAKVYVDGICGEVLLGNFGFFSCS